MKIKLIIALLSLSTVLHAMPVFDWANWIENAAIAKQQIEQYKNQLNQYNNMLDNTKSLSTYQWDDANGIINNLLETTDTLDYYKQQAGSLEGYLNQYQSQDYYQNSPCFNGHCSKEELAKLKQNQLAASKAQKRANDARLRGIDKQQQNLKQDSQKLKQLQRQAETVEGQKQAIQAANQLASAQTNQLLQIRGLLVAGQNAESARAQAVANKEAIQAAGDERFRAGTFRKSSGKKW